MTRITPEGTTLVPLRGQYGSGRFATVDTSHPQLQTILDCRWYVNEKNYARSFDWPEEPGVTVKLHHIVTGTRPPIIIDHINRDTLDNRLSNLRIAMASENAMNRRHPRGKVAYRGVSARETRFHAKIRWQNEHLHLGDFDTAKDAARVYDLFALLIAGEFAATNAPARQYRGLVMKLQQHILARALKD
ncbi:HNH endonuclease [Deinococcus aquaticus]|uniref:HNH endonuclease n=1 Tax=Deinococcus aquaticus TaxID=328692 RepID=UPI003F4882ED